MKLKDIDTTRKILIIGASGTGKTTIVGTLCKLMPTLVVTADKEGLDTLRTMGLNPDVLVVSDWKHVWDYFQEIKEASEDHLAIAFDDFGSIQTTTRRKIEQMPIGRGEEKAANPDEIKRQLMRGERRMQIRQWGELWLAIETFLYEVLSLPFVVKLVTVLEGISRDPRTEEEVITPSLLGQTRTTLPARFSLVAESAIYQINGKTHYTLHCCSHGKIETKSRYREGRVWVDPTMKKVLLYTENKDEAETDIEKKIHNLLRGA